MVATSDILFSELKIATLDKVKVLKEIYSVSEEHWIYDKYRNSWLLPVVTENGSETSFALSKSKTSNPSFKFTPHQLPTLHQYIENHVYSWLSSAARVMLLRTSPNEKNNEHIDCSREQFGSRQHKFRYVLQGKSDTLYFITQGGKLKIPRTDLPFIIDGSWPHGMHNDAEEDKITLCLGAPWTGEENYPMLGKKLLKSDYLAPANIDHYFHSY